jgi:hypothetical protein
VTFEDRRDNADMESVTTDWTDLLTCLVSLQEQDVTVRISEPGARVAELRGRLDRATGFSADPDALLLWVGRGMPSASFVISREYLGPWRWIEDDGIAELRLQHGCTSIMIDFSPGAGAP